MAYNPNVPAPTNRVQDDIAAMRGNFQHLAPLAQAVGELQAVSGLAQAVDELQAVSGLAPYVQALLDSRIVEMGSNSNGEYVRFENGCQVCWFANDPAPNFTARTEGAVSGYRYADTWTYPAAFSANPSVVAIGRGFVGSQAQTSLNTSISLVSTTTVDIQLWAWNQVNANVTICRIAIGRWK